MRAARSRSGLGAVLLVILLTGSLHSGLVGGDESVDDGARAKRLQGELSNLQKQLKNKEKEVSKLLKTIETLQGEKEHAVNEAEALRSASKESDSTAKSELAKLKLELREKHEQLLEHQSTCSANEGQVEVAQKQVERLSADLEAIQKAQKKFEAESDSNSKKATKAMEELKKSLLDAQKDATESKAALAQAQESALATVEQLNELLGAWLPIWLTKRYDQAASAVRPQLDYAWQKGGEYATLASEQSAKVYELSRTKSQEAWEAAAPTAQQYYAASETALRDGYASSKKFAAPHIATAQNHGKRYWLTSKLHLNKLLTHPKLIQARRELKLQQAAFEKRVAKQLQQYPALKAYAKQPYLSYITWAALALPLTIIFLPFLLFGGGKRASKTPKGSPPAASAQPAASVQSSQDLPGGVVTEKSATTSSTYTPKPRKAKAKRIVEGEEGVSFA